MTMQDRVDLRAMGNFLPELDLTDRCDRCGARGFFSVLIVAASSVLVFCGHHFAEYELALRDKAIAIRDDGWRM